MLAFVIFVVWRLGILSYALLFIINVIDRRLGNGALL